MSKSRKTYMESDWRPTIGCIQKLRDKYPRINLEYYIEEARDGALSSGKLYADFDAYFRNWVRRAGNFGAIQTLRSVPDTAKPTADVVDLFIRRKAKSLGIDTDGKTDSQLKNDVFHHEHPTKGAR